MPSARRRDRPGSIRMGDVGGSTSTRSARGTLGLVVDLARPYRGQLVIILLAIMVETATSLAAAWPLKIVIDNAIGPHAVPEWVTARLSAALIVWAGTGGGRGARHHPVPCVIVRCPELPGHVVAILRDDALRGHRVEVRRRRQGVRAP